MNRKKILYISIFKTLLFNFHYFGFKGILKLPIIIARGVQIKALKGKVELDHMYLGQVKIGFPSLGTRNNSTTKGCLEIRGKVVFHYKCSFAKGASISVGENGILEIGSLNITGDSNIICKKRIFIGNSFLMSWGGYIMDHDCHKIYVNGKLQNPDKEIIIGNHVWVGMNVTILKGSIIPDGSVIGAGSIVTHQLSEKQSIYINNTEVKKNITWEE